MRVDRRTFVIGLGASAALLPIAGCARPSGPSPVDPVGKKGVMLMNRIGPSSSELYIANADGSDERKLLQDSHFEYGASYAADGKSLVFTSERNGDGNSNLFRCNANGSNVEPLVGGPSMSDAGALSPDGAHLAFVSTREGFRANIWTLHTETGELSNVTGGQAVQGDQSLPDGFFRPAWSPDGKWLAFSSDRNTEWRGHGNGTGWEHTQELSVYVIGLDGQGFRRIATKPGYCLGTPKWSPDGKRVAFYEMLTEDTWGARRPEGVAKVSSQIVSVDVASGARIEHTSGPGLKVFPHFLSPTDLAYHRKGGADEGLAYTSGAPAVPRILRSPAWSPDGRSVVYEKNDFSRRAQNAPLYSWDPEWEYRYTDVFPAMSQQGELVVTEKASNSSIGVMAPDGSHRERIFDASRSGIDPAELASGTAGAFKPAWSPDGNWIAFGIGQWFQERATGKATLMRVRRDGTDAEALTDGTVHSGFPSYSPDGREIVFRTWTTEGGTLSILDLDTRRVRTLTTEFDNLPDWSPDGSRIVFTRKVDSENFDVYTIAPDGSDLLRLTTHRANDAHATWTADGRITWSSGTYGFREEAALYDQTFQQYGQIWIMNADGTGKRVLTDSRWEDSMPLYIPNP